MRFIFETWANKTSKISLSSSSSAYMQHTGINYDVQFVEHSVLPSSHVMLCICGQKLCFYFQQMVDSSLEVEVVDMVEICVEMSF